MICLKVLLVAQEKEVLVGWCMDNEIEGVSKKFGEWYHKQTKQKIQTN